MFIKRFEEFTSKSNAFIIKTERVSGIEPKIFSGGSLLNFYIRIYIGIDENTYSKTGNIYTLDDITLVKYQLHPSYKDPMRISTDRENKFEIKVWTYGFYRVKAFINLKMAQSLEIDGKVDFPVSPAEQATNGKEVSWS